MVAQKKIPDLLDLTGLNTADFTRQGGQYEYHGPCPDCHGGNDRFIIRLDWNWYFCRQCNWPKGASLDRFRDTPLTSKEKKKLQKEYESGRKQQQEEIDKNRTRLRNLNLHMKFHKQLLNQPALLDLMMRPGGLLEGYKMHTIKRWMVGIDHHYRMVDDHGMVHETDALAFPIFDAQEQLLNIRMRYIDLPVVGTWERAGRGRYRPIWNNLGLAMTVADYWEKDIPDTHWTVMVEGEKKAQVLHQEGIPALGIFGIHCIPNDWYPWLLNRYDKIVMIHEEAWDGNKNVEGAINHLMTHLENITVLKLEGKPDSMLAHRELTPLELAKRIGEVLA